MKGTYLMTKAEVNELYKNLKQGILFLADEIKSID